MSGARDLADRLDSTRRANEHGEILHRQDLANPDRWQPVEELARRASGDIAPALARLREPIVDRTLPCSAWGRCRSTPSGGSSPSGGPIASRNERDGRATIGAGYPRGIRASWRDWATSWPAVSHTSPSSSNMP